jgi:hypothetical protein
MQQTQSVDVSSAAKQANANLAAINTYAQTSKDQKKLRRQAGNSKQPASEKVSNQLDKISKQQKRFQRNVPTSMGQMLDLIGLTSGSSGNTNNYVRRLILQTAVKSEPEIKNIIKEAALKGLGCTSEQKYQGVPASTFSLTPLDLLPAGSTITIPVQNLDLVTLASGMLKQNFDQPIGSIFYEQDTPNVDDGVYKPYAGKDPFPMNKELNMLISTPNQSFQQTFGKFYQGTSGQYLLDMQYQRTNEFGVFGDFFKVALIDRSGAQIPNQLSTTGNTVGEFLSDYFDTIKLFDTQNLTTQIMQFLFQFVSKQAGLGSGEIAQSSKFYLIAQRILGLCFDSRREIDVSGVSKVAELDGIDDSFFELTDVDLRNLDLEISNVQNGVIELVDCNNVKLPINSANITAQLVDLGAKLSGLTTDQQVTAIENILDSVTQNPNWKLYTNSNFNASGAISRNLIQNIALAVASAALSPKVLLPIMVMSNVVEKTAINNYNTAVGSANTQTQSATTTNSQVNNIITDATAFLKKFKKFSIEVISKIGAIFLRTLFELLKKDILGLLGAIIEDISNSERKKRYKKILRLVGIATQLAGEIIRGLDDYRKCKSLLDEINNIINIINGLPRPRSKIPVVLAILSDFLPGESPERATINGIKYMQELGIPTGPLPDGSPNISIQALLASQKGDKDEQAENGVSDSFIVPNKQGTPRIVTLPR